MRTKTRRTHRRSRSYIHCRNRKGIILALFSRTNNPKANEWERKNHRKTQNNVKRRVAPEHITKHTA